MALRDQTNLVDLTDTTDEDDYVRIDYNTTGSGPVLPLVDLPVPLSPLEEPTNPVIQPVLTQSFELQPNQARTTSSDSLASVASLDPVENPTNLVAESLRHDREVLLRRFLTLLTDDIDRSHSWYDRLTVKELYQDGNFVLSYQPVTTVTTGTPLLICQDYIQYHDGIIFFSDRLQSYGKTVMAQQSGLPGSSLEIAEKFNIAATIMKTLAIPIT